MPSQLSLFDAPSRFHPRIPSVRALAKDVAQRLSCELGISVRLTVTDNRTSMVSFRRNPSALTLRLHHMFLSAPESVLRAVADYAGRGHKKAGPVLDAFIRGQEPLIRRQSSSPGILQARGRVFDLKEIFDQVNRSYFQGGIQARIGWGRPPAKRTRRSIRLGVYDHQNREIRIHPALDRPLVPLYFVEFIVFHEMLHQLFPSPAGALRHIHHPRAFRDREKSFAHYALALRWERENLRSLLRG
jgi:hypothetical protein